MGSGSVDFESQSIEYVQSTHGCQNLHDPEGSTRWEQTPFAVYMTFPRGLGSGVTSRSRPWVRVPLDEYGSGVTLQAFLTSPDLLGFFASLSSPLTEMGSERIRGVATTEYSGSASLAAMYASAERSNPVLYSAPSSSVDLVPAATAIRITAQFWIDAKGRLRQIRASEPLYTAIYQDGSDTEGAAQAPAIATEGGTPATTLPDGTKISAEPLTHVAIRTLRQQDFDQVTVDLYDFGPRRIEVPSTSLISPLKH